MLLFAEAFGEDGISNVPDQRDKLMDLLDEPSLGVVNSVMSLLLGLVSHFPQYWGAVVTKCCKLMVRLNHPSAGKDLGMDYVYYKTVNPWLQVRREHLPARLSVCFCALPPRPVGKAKSTSRLRCVCALPPACP